VDPLSRDRTRLSFTQDSARIQNKRPRRSCHTRRGWLQVRILPPGWPLPLTGCRRLHDSVSNRISAFFPADRSASTKLAASGDIPPCGAGQSIKRVRQFSVRRRYVSSAVQACGDGDGIILARFQVAVPLLLHRRISGESATESSFQCRLRTSQCDRPGASPGIGISRGKTQDFTQTRSPNASR